MVGIEIGVGHCVCGPDDSVRKNTHREVCVIPPNPGVQHIVSAFLGYLFSSLGFVFPL